MNKTNGPLYLRPPLLPAGYQVKVWIPQQSGLFLPRQVLSPVGSSGLEIPQGADLAPAGRATFPALHEEPVEKGFVAQHKDWKQKETLSHSISQAPFLKEKYFKLSERTNSKKKF